MKQLYTLNTTLKYILTSALKAHRKYICMTDIQQLVYIQQFYT